MTKLAARMQRTAMLNQTEHRRRQGGKAMVAAVMLDACPPATQAQIHGQIPASLHRTAIGGTSPARAETVCCSMYCDDAMLANGLIAIGSFKRFAPKMRAVIFSPTAKACSWLRGDGVDVIDADAPLQACHIDVKGWSRQHPGITGHYYRKVAMWLHMLGGPSSPTADWHAFIDADVLFVRPIRAMMQYVRGHRFAAMVEHWHQSVWSVFGEETPLSQHQAGQLFHRQARRSSMKQTSYFNSGVMLARPDPDVIAAVKDVMLASILYPELSRDIRLPEQTLLNVAMMVRKIPCRDLFGLCVPSYHDHERHWPTPIVRHYLGDPLHRQPAALRARYPKLVDESLAAVGTSVEELKARGLWNDRVSFLAPSVSLENALASEGLLASEEGLLAEASFSTTDKARLLANRPSAFSGG
jgi:hypothetical protein